MKNKILEFIATIILILFVVGILNGGKMIWNYFFRNSDDEVITEVSDSEKIGNNSIEDHKENDNKLTNLSLIENTDFKNFLINEYRWAEKNKIKLNCYEEIETVANWYDSQKEKIDTKLMYMKKKSGKYSRTLNESDYMYYGEMDNDTPDGLGIIIYIDDMITDSTDSPYKLIKYIGYFKDGKPEGYGLEFNIPDLNEITLTDGLKENMSLVNSVYYEGYFEDGEWETTGNVFFSNLYGIVMDTPYANQNHIDISKIKYYITVGEMRNNDINGNAIYYNSDGTKIYEGTVKNGAYKTGCQYFLGTNKIKYKGEFYDNLYNGEGTLYDENGNIIYEGKFIDGDIL